MKTNATTASKHSPISRNTINDFAMEPPQVLGYDDDLFHLVLSDLLTWQWTHTEGQLNFNQTSQMPIVIWQML